MGEFLIDGQVEDFKEEFFTSLRSGAAIGSEVRVIWPTVERAAEAMHAATEEGVGHGLTVDGRFNVRYHVLLTW